METLYRLTTQGLGSFYVVANDPTDAETKLKTLLTKYDYGMSCNRIVTNIEIISREINDDFTGNNKLIL